MLNTKNIGKINKNLTKKQKSRIRSTPFQWIIEIVESISLFGVLVSELVNRWVGVSNGFRIHSKVIHLKPLDVCVALGLRIVGKKVPYIEREVDVENDGDCHMMYLFEGDNITSEKIQEKLDEFIGDDDVEDFVRKSIF
ncbi:hypothetical protein VNO77_02948 [Canavalia gladiata]|uniref:Uncharacterized protein n=1 Tax=Canavalia gladiata TaxID=3824 RepID=A0AAN9MTW5_CANGL